MAEGQEIIQEYVPGRTVTLLPGSLDVWGVVKVSYGMFELGQGDYRDRKVVAVSVEREQADAEAARLKQEEGKHEVLREYDWGGEVKGITFEVEAIRNARLCTITELQGDLIV